MKKIFLSAAVVLALATSSFAQSYSAMIDMPFLRRRRARTDISGRSRRRRLRALP
jgi:hypothetical protein